MAVSFACPHCSTTVPSTDLPIADCPVCGRSFASPSTAVTLDPPSGPPSTQANIATLDPHAALSERSAPSNPSTSTLPMTIGRFVVKAKLGEGAFGIVYRGYDPQLDREVAIKVGKPHMLDTPDRIQRFLREAKAAANLRHPHIVPLFETGHDGERYYIASAFVEGNTLETKIEEHGECRPWEPKTAAALVRKLSEALAYAHTQGIVHRDVKPANVLVDANGDPHVLDFGLAARAGDEIVKTQDGKILGTPAYMSPEQAAGKAREAGPAADQYALGVVLYELLTGRRPFDGPFEMVIFQHGHVEPKRLRAVEPRVPWELEAICLKCLEKEPTRRYESCTHLAEDLERWADGRSVLAKRPGPLGRMVKWAGRNPMAAGLMTAVVLSLTAGTITSGWLANRAERRAESEAEARRAEADQRVRAERSEKAAIESANQERLAKQDAEAKRLQAEQNLAFARKGNAILGSVFAGLDPRANHATVAELRNTLKANLAKAVQQLEGSAIGDPLVVAELQTTLGMSLLGLGEYHLAVEVLEKARRIRTDRLGSEHTDTLTSTNNLALAYREAGRLDRALPLYETTLEIRKTQLGSDHPDTLISMNNLALGYQESGQLDRAIPLFEKTFELTKQKLGADHNYTLTCMNNLASAYREAGRYDQAVPLDEKSVLLAKAKLGSDHPDTLICMNNLALDYQESGQLGLALPLYEMTLKLRTIKLGADHPDTLISLNNLALGYQASGQLDLAIPLFEKTFETNKAKLGADHPYTLISMHNLALGYEEDGQVNRALPLYERLLEIEKSKYGSDHPDTLSSMFNLGVMYCDSLQGEKASSLLNEYITEERKLYPKTDPRFAELLETVSQKLLGCDQYRVAETMLRESLTIREKSQPGAWTTFNTQSLLGEALVGQKKYVDAEPLLLKGYDGLNARVKSIPPEEIGRVSQALDRVIALYTAINKLDEVKKYQTLQERISPTKTPADND